MGMNGSGAMGCGERELRGALRSLRLGLLALAFAAGLAGPLPAAAGEAADSLMELLRASGAELRTLGRRGALDGWMVAPPGKAPYALYVDGTGHAVMGLLFAPDGSELTRAQVAAVPGGRALLAGVTVARGLDAPARPAASGVSRAGGDPPAERAPLAGVLEAALAVEGFDLGQVGPRVAVFADPTCLPSRGAVARLARRALDGEIRLRVVPVGVRGGDAEALAGAVVASPDRARAWFEAGREGRLPEASQEGAAGAAMNRRLFERTGSAFVPLTLMHDAGGGAASAVGLDFEAWFGGEAG